MKHNTTPQLELSTLDPTPAIREAARQSRYRQSVSVLVMLCCKDAACKCLEDTEFEERKD